MNVTVTLFATLEDRLPGGTGQVEINADATVHDLLQELGIDDEDAGVVTVNGLAASRDTRLAHGDKVLVVPLIGGG